MTPAAWRAPRARHPAASPRSLLQSRPGASACLRGGRKSALIKQCRSASCASDPLRPLVGGLRRARPRHAGRILRWQQEGRCSAAQRCDDCQEAAGLRWWHACFRPEPACAGMMRGPCLMSAALQRKQAVPARCSQPAAAPHTRHTRQAACERARGSLGRNALTQAGTHVALSGASVRQGKGALFSGLIISLRAGTAAACCARTLAWLFTMPCPALPSVGTMHAPQCIRSALRVFGQNAGAGLRSQPRSLLACRACAWSYQPAPVVLVTERLELGREVCELTDFLLM